MIVADRIADVHDIAKLFEVVNEFIGALQEKPEIQHIAVALRPGRIKLEKNRLLPESCVRKDQASGWHKTRSQADVRAARCAETALQRVRGDWSH